MTILVLIANVSSAAVFLCFGLLCLFADGMRADFDRFGLSHLRIVTGVLEVLGAFGLVAGLLVPVLTLVSAAGLALLMALGLLTRLRQRDSLRLMLPAGALMLMNAMIAWQAATTRV